MHADADLEHHRSLEIEINRRATGIPDASGRGATALTRQGRRRPAHLADLTGDVDDGRRCGDRLNERMGHSEKEPTFVSSSDWRGSTSQDATLALGAAVPSPPSGRLVPTSISQSHT